MDAVELEGFGETQKCKLGARYSSLLRETHGEIVCPAPPYAAPALATEDAARREVLQAELSAATAAQQVAEATLAMRRADPGAISWEVEQAEAAALEARARRRRLTSALAPPPTTLPVELALNGGDGTLLALASAAAVRFTYYHPPRLEPPSPSSALAAGGTMVTLAGDGFGFGDTNTTKCRFGAEQLVAAVEASRDGVVCEAPPAARLGPAAVQLTLNDQDYMEAGEVFYYSCLLYTSPSPRD